MWNKLYLEKRENCILGLPLDAETEMWHPSYCKKIINAHCMQKKKNKKNNNNLFWAFIKSPVGISSFLTNTSIALWIFKLEMLAWQITLRILFLDWNSFWIIHWKVSQDKPCISIQLMNGLQSIAEPQIFIMHSHGVFKLSANH